MNARGARWQRRARLLKRRGEVKPMAARNEARRLPPENLLGLHLEASIFVFHYRAMRYRWKRLGQLLAPCIPGPYGRYSRHVVAIRAR
ncbi:hypothetical protein MRB53_041044 [Persea americana]|nr:hypothetical protein MRB53_041044 [Persea americana]